MQKITPFLWFNGQAEEAANFYCSIFQNSRITNVSRYGEAGPLPAGTVLVVNFELEGMEFMALNANENYPFTHAVSFMVHCDTQDEVDHLWDNLVDGGEPVACGWLKDKFGLSWQITPRILGELISDPDPVKANRVMVAMMSMVKLDIAALKRAYDGD